MGRMTQNTFKTLFEYGKKVYNGDMDLSSAATAANAQNPEVATSSARHYILWYSKMRSGEFLTWNSNSELLLYYVQRIIEEEGSEAGELAIVSAKQFAKHHSRIDLDQALDKLGHSKPADSPSLPEALSTCLEQNKEQFKLWLKQHDKGYQLHTIYKYVRALEKAGEWLLIDLPNPIFAVSDLEEFEKLLQILKSVPNFEEINQAHGHGDLSAALTRYQKFLSEENTASHATGKYDSWEIIDNTTAIKHCDKSFFDYRGSGVPKGICWFFNADNMVLGETRAIKLIYNGTSFQASVKNESSDRRRVRVFWSTELGNQFEAYKQANAVATFRRVSDDTYEVSIKGGEKELTIKAVVAAIKEYIAAKGFTYKDDLIENFYLSLKSKPFVILAGTSGTGKTKLVQYFAEAIGAEMLLVPVRPDWSDSSDLFGHSDLSSTFHPGAVLKFLQKARGNLNTPHILCLDEMNLARVEYYFSDFLSILETRKWDSNKTIVTMPLVDENYYKDDNAAQTYGAMAIPENFYIVGTVNMDETTFPFSKKVLDRANTIEFSLVDLTARPVRREEAAPQTLPNSFLRADYLNLLDCDEEQVVTDTCEDLQAMNQLLEKANLHVGYRVRDEIVFYMLNRQKADLLTPDSAFDHEIMQKILPRIQGSSTAIKELLCDLFVECAGDYSRYSGKATHLQMEEYLKQETPNYPQTAKKIAFMMRRFEEDGFTSYWL